MIMEFLNFGKLLSLKFSAMPYCRILPHIAVMWNWVHSKCTLKNVTGFITTDQIFTRNEIQIK